MATRKKDKVVVPLSYQDKYESALESFNLRQDLHVPIPDPTFVLCPGDKVIYGALKDCIIEEVLHDGKMYHLSYHDTGLHYGQPYDNGRSARVVPWHEVVLRSGVKNTQFSAPGRLDYYSNTSVNSIINRVYNAGVFNEPEYQRDYVWTLEDKQKLIHSVMQRFDIGKFLFIKHEYDPNKWFTYEILDGKQRLTALQEFYEGRFEYKGHKYHELSFADRRAFDDHQVTYSDVSEIRLTKADKLYLFLSVNVAGVPQTAAHMQRIYEMYQAELIKEKTKC